MISSSWDKTIRIWDLCSSDPPQCLAFPEKFLLSEICGDFTVMAHGHKNSVFIVDLRNPSTFERRVSSLGRQIRSACAARPVPFGWAIGSIDGRIAIEYLGNLRQQAQRFSFSTARHEAGETATLFPVNALCFHPQSGVLVSGNCAGNICFWDLEFKRKLAEVQYGFGVGLAGMDYNSDGNVLALAFSYTWDKGEIEHPNDRLVLRATPEQTGVRNEGDTG